jgi:hypothetical protein
MMNAANFLPITLALRDGDVDEAIFITGQQIPPPDAVSRSRTSTACSTSS